MKRHPAVAGQFYPGTRAPLEGQLREFCDAPPESPIPLGAISPHAGYIYSGAIAGHLFSQINVPNKVVLLGPNHHGAGHPGAVSAVDAWETPLGDIFIDKPLSDSILTACRHFAVDEKAHRYEHSLEVQVPFIQHCNPAAKFVPICIGHLPLDALIESGEALADVIAGQDEPVLIIASSDMTHFESADEAKKKDDMALRHVESLDPEGLYRTVVENRISMCGVMPSVVMLAAARKLGARKGEVVAYGTSGDVTGDLRDVVAYASVVVR
jgi:AmmeMemoRadiSam system protein B